MCGHTVSLLLFGLLRLVIVNKRRQLRLLKFYLYWGGFFFSGSFGLGWIFGFGVLSLQGQLVFLDGCKELSVFFLRDGVVLFDAANNVPK